MYRTDKQFMKDPATAHARIYIGNIAESVVAENLEQKFRSFFYFMYCLLVLNTHSDLPK